MATGRTFASAIEEREWKITRLCWPVLNFRVTVRFPVAKGGGSRLFFETIFGAIFYSLLPVRSVTLYPIRQPSVQKICGPFGALLSSAKDSSDHEWGQRPHFRLQKRCSLLLFLFSYRASPGLSFCVLWLVQVATAASYPEYYLPGNFSSLQEAKRIARKRKCAKEVY
ncbi:D-fructose-6-phosphate amidotransferase [Anopheles sinensis]|uniref:D-fructose-6-phosphate amidotransferase n=1 Tax=Anopheles sinensis TaxID=74873 RepID=A0A084WMD5_ANOSI|nr:D-fructose-6-phosphate amidotransferase [Anopheles sinensis]